MRRTPTGLKVDVQLVAKFSSGDASFMDDAIAVKSPAQSHYRIDSDRCESCDALHAMSLQLMVSKEKFVESTLSSDRLVSQDYSNKISACRDSFALRAAKRSITQ